jgi:hypothetical protein
VLRRVNRRTAQQTALPPAARLRHSMASNDGVGARRVFIEKVWRAFSEVRRRSPEREARARYFPNDAGAARVLARGH